MFFNLIDTLDSLNINLFSGLQMFSIINVISYLPKKSLKTQNIELDISMIGFYSQAFELTVKFLKELVPQDKNAFKLLNAYFEIVKNQRDNICKLNTARLNFLDDLRFVIISHLENSAKKEQKALKRFHSILHLISLLNNNKLSLFYVVNTWLNSNSRIDDDNEIVHALRGNIGNLIKLYPNCREAFEELTKIEAHYRNCKISSLKYSLLRKEWIQNYYYSLPCSLQDIFTGKIQYDFHWSEILCFKLAYGSSKNSLNDVLKEMNDLISCKDEIYYILTNNYDELIKSSSGWIKMIYCLLYNISNRSDIYDSILELGNNLLKLDWQVALDYFSFTAYSNHFFDKIILNLNMNPVIFDFLQRYAIRNNFNLDGLNKTYANCLLKQRNFIDYLKFINNEHLADFDVTTDFLNFIFENYNEVKEHFNNSFLKTELGLYLILLDKLINGHIELWEDEISAFLQHKYTFNYIRKILDIFIESKNISELVLIKILDFILHKHKDLILDNKDTNIYKIKLIEKLYKRSK